MLNDCDQCSVPCLGGALVVEVFTSSAVDLPQSIMKRGDRDHSVGSAVDLPQSVLRRGDRDHSVGSWYVLDRLVGRTPV